MTWIEAKNAGPGFYQTPRGRVVCVVLPSRVSGRWPTPHGTGEIPYRTYGDPDARSALDRLDVFGWLRPDYALHSLKMPPAYVARIFAERRQRFEEV